MSDFDPRKIQPEYASDENREPVMTEPSSYTPSYLRNTPYHVPEDRDPFTSQGFYEEPHVPQNPEILPQAPIPPSPASKKRSVGVIILITVILCALVFGSLGYGIASAVANRRVTNFSQREDSIPGISGGEDPGSSDPGTLIPSPGNNDQSTFPGSSENSGAPVIRPDGGENGALTLTYADTFEELPATEVVAFTADSVVEITTEFVTTGAYMQQYISSGAGSGVIVTADGYILTNNHVIEKATSISVTLRNGEVYPARLIGLDENLDIALLKIEASHLTVAKIGSSSTLLAGQPILAIGNPLGQLGGSVSSGIISALDRNITISGTTMNLLQIDCSINPGNSGGALFDMCGNLVGIVNAKSVGDNVDGIGFAIPIDHVLPILDDLFTYGYVKGKAFVGITMVDITTPQMAYMYGVSEIGTYIYSVIENSAAHRAGLKPGDRILAVNNAEITSASEVTEIISSLSVGTEIVMKVMRGGQETDIRVTIGEYIPSGIRSENITGLLA